MVTLFSDAPLNIVLLIPLVLFGATIGVGYILQKLHERKRK